MQNSENESKEKSHKYWWSHSPALWQLVFDVYCYRSCSTKIIVSGPYKIKKQNFKKPIVYFLLETLLSKSWS